MKVHLENNEVTALTLMPELGSDEILLAAIARILVRGGKIRLKTTDNVEVECEFPCKAHIEDEEMAVLINQYISCLD